MRAAIAKAKTAGGAGTGGKVAVLLRETKGAFFAALDDDVNTPDSVYRVQQMTEALAEQKDLSAEEGRAVVDAYREFGRILGLFTDLP